MDTLAQKRHRKPAGGISWNGQADHSASVPSEHLARRDEVEGRSHLAPLFLCPGMNPVNVPSASLSSCLFSKWASYFSGFSTFSHHHQLCPTWCVIHMGLWSGSIWGSGNLCRWALRWTLFTFLTLIPAWNKLDHFSNKNSTRNSHPHPLSYYF